MLYTNEITVSTKTLEAAQECLGHLTEGTGAIVAEFKALQMMKKVGDLAEKTVGNLRRQHGVKTGKKQEATWFNQTA